MRLPGWFREEGESVVLNPLVEDNISCVAADKEHLHIRRQGTNLVIAFSTVSFRHDRIQNEKIYVVCLPELLYCLGPVSCLDGGISILGQNIPHEVAYRFVVL